MHSNRIPEKGHEFIKSQDQNGSNCPWRGQPIVVTLVGFLEKENISK